MHSAIVRKNLVCILLYIIQILNCDFTPCTLMPIISISVQGDENMRGGTSLCFD